MNEDWIALVGQYHPTGSRYICNPPVMDTDEDWVCLPKEKNVEAPWKEYESLNKLEEKLKQIGFVSGGSYNPENPFVSMKRKTGDTLTNLILVDDQWEYGKWVMASKLAKRFNLTNKEDRIAVFEAVVRHNTEFEYYQKQPEEWL